MKLSPAHYPARDPSKALCDALTARLRGSPPPTLAQTKAAALEALQTTGEDFRTIRVGKPHLLAGSDGRPVARVEVTCGETPRGLPWLVMRYQGAAAAPFDWFSWAQVPAAGLTPSEIAEALGQAGALS